MRHIKNIIFCLFILYASVISAGEFKQYILHNGLKIIIKADHHAPTIALQVWYKASNTLMQTMIANNTNHTRALYLKKILFSMGDIYNTFNTPEYTVYKHLAPATQLEKILELESYNMSQLLFEDEALFNAEKNNYLTKITLDNNTNVANLMLEKFYKTAYDLPVNAYNLSIIQLQLNNLNEYYNNYYTPNNALLIIAGDVNTDSCYKLINTYFGQISKHTNVPLISQQLSKLALGYRRLVVKIPTHNNYLFAGYNLPSLNTAVHHWEPFALKVLSLALRQSLLQHDKVFNLTEFSYNPFALHESLMYLSLIPVDVTDLVAIEEIIQQAIEQLKTNLIATSQLQYIKNKILAEHEHHQQSLFKQIDEIGRLEVAGYNWKNLGNYSTAIKRVTAKQLQIIAKKYLVADNLTIMHVLPEGI